MATQPHALILRYEDIERELRNGLIANSDPASVQASSYDLRIGTLFRGGQIINAAHSQAKQQFVIEPGEIVTILTLEELQLPSDMIAIAFPMNKWSSEGLLVLNPGFVDPGFKGPLSVKMVNLRKTRISIEREQPIFTVSFFRMGAETGHPYTRNEPRHDRELKMNMRELEQSADSIAELMKFAPTPPYTTAEQVKNIVREQPFMTIAAVDTAIREHWMSRTVFFSAIIAALTGIAAIVLAVISLVKAH